MLNLLLIFLGGGLGSLARFGISVLLVNPSAKFPWGTLVANILASVLAGFLLAYFAKHHSPQNLRSLGLMGFCGGFSTFSTFSLESYQMIEAGNWSIALLYVVTSAVACILGVGLGIYLIK